MLKPEEVSMKSTAWIVAWFRLARIISPHSFIDVQHKLLFYVVAAWEDDFTGYVIDYGCYPDQQRPYFTLREARQTLSSEATGTGLEGSIYAGLESLTSKLLDREWQRDDGAAMRIGRCLIDANWGQSTDVVYQFCRQSKHAAVITPATVGSSALRALPFSEYRRPPGDRVGAQTGVSRTSMVSGPYVTWSTIPTGGSRLSTLGFVFRWVIAVASRSLVRTPKRIVCSPSIKPQSTSSRPRPAVEVSTNGSSDRSSLTTTWLELLGCFCGPRHPCKAVPLLGTDNIPTSNPARVSLRHAE